MDKNCWGNLGFGFVKFSMCVKLFEAEDDLEYRLFFFLSFDHCLKDPEAQIKHHFLIFSDLLCLFKDARERF